MNYKTKIPKTDVFPLSNTNLIIKIETNFRSGNVIIYKHMCSVTICYLVEKTTFKVVFVVVSFVISCIIQICCKAKYFS